MGSQYWISHFVGPRMGECTTVDNLFAFLTISGPISGGFDIRCPGVGRFDMQLRCGVPDLSVVPHRTLYCNGILAPACSPSPFRWGSEHQTSGGCGVGDPADSIAPMHIPGPSPTALYSAQDEGRLWGRNPSLGACGLCMPVRNPTDEHNPHPVLCVCVCVFVCLFV